MNGYVLFIGYIVGLLLSGLYSDWSIGPFEVFDWPTIDVTVGMGVSLLAGTIASLLCPRIWRMGPRSSTWLMMGVIGMVAGGYVQVRSPTYTSLLYDMPPQSQPTFPIDVGVQGNIVDAPKLTRSHAVRFTLHVTDIQSWQDTLYANAPDYSGSKDEEDAAAGKGTVQASVALHRVAHKLYVTVPLLQGTGLKPGDAIALYGQLNRPQPNHIPGAFDFQQYLERQGIFTTLQAKQVAPSEAQALTGESIPIVWRRATWGIRQRIVRSFVKGLDSPAGPLLSAMVLGRKAVDLSFDIRDEFIQAGLAHILAASGFHVSLLLGAILLMTRRCSPHLQLWIGIGVLMGYASLTGLQPSVCRAVLMGVAVLIANVTERKIRPLGALLGIATVLLLIEPIWIWDLGFQLSFLATVGLVVMVPSLVKRMDWLPVGIATAIAVPIAAMTWTLPILLRMMGTILPYSVILGVFLTPVIGLISLAGMLTGATALVSPSVGSVLVSLWYWPLHGLITAVEVCNRLPGQSLALGSINLGQMVSLYGLYTLMIWPGQTLYPAAAKRSVNRLAKSSTQRGQGLGWRLGKGRSLRKLAILATLTLVLVPLFYGRYQKVQITIFPTSALKSSPPFMLIQNRGHIGLINNGTAKDVQYSLLPFLRHEGINRLDWAIATQPYAESPSSSRTQTNTNTIETSPWHKLAQTVPIQRIYTLRPETSHPETLHPETAHPENSSFSRQVMTVGQSITFGPKCTLGVLSTSPAILELAIEHHHWLIMDHQVPSSASTLMSLPLPSSDVWYWGGTDLATHADVLQQLSQEQLPLQAIITSVLPQIDQTEMARLANGYGSRTSPLSSIALYSPSHHHVVQWMPESGFSIASDVINQEY